MEWGMELINMYKNYVNLYIILCKLGLNFNLKMIRDLKKILLFFFILRNSKLSFCYYYFYGIILYLLLY